MKIVTIVTLTVIIITIITASKPSRVKSSCRSLEIKGKDLMFILLCGSTETVAIKQPESLMPYLLPLVQPVTACFS